MSRKQSFTRDAFPQLSQRNHRSGIEEAGVPGICEKTGRHDYDSEFSALGKPEDSLFAMDTRDCVYYLNSFSKTIGPAFRMAYLLLPKTRAEADSRKISFYSCSVPVLEQCLLTELLQSGEFERHINRIRRKRRSHVTSGDTK